MTSDESIQTYVIDLTQFVAWTGDVTQFRVRFADADHATAGRSSGTGNIIIDDIVFEFDASLSTTDFETTSLSFYLNTTNSIINIEGNTNISKLELFDITGKKVLETTNINNNSIDISSLKAGIYLLSIYNDSNESITKKVVKN